MITALRRRHRRAILALTLGLPPLLALALLRRPEPATMATIPALLAAASPASGSGALLWERDDLWTALPAITRLFADAPGGAPAALELAPRRDPMRPDVLLYWGADGAADRIPEGALLLGRLAGGAPRRFALREAARGGGGRLWLYSLGHQQLLDSAALPAARP